jgi:hypothetical protein
MTDITTTAADPPEAPQEPLEPAVQGPPATPTPDDLLHAIFDAVREELEIEESEEGGADQDLLLELRTVDKAVVSNAQGKAIITFEVDKEFPSMPGSRVIAMAVLPVEGSMPGDLRIYVAPPAPLAGVRDYSCMTFNRMSLGQAKEVMSRELFVAGVAEEFVRLLEPEDDEDEEDDEEEGETLCGDEECESTATYVCTCQVCTPAVDEAKFFACEAHRSRLDPEHLKENKRPAKWEKLPTNPANPAVS